MKKRNFKKYSSIVLLLTMGLLLASFKSAGKLEQKVDALIKKTYSIEKYQKKTIVVSQDVEDTVPKQISNCLFSVSASDRIVGYIYIGQASSMKNVFDYAVLFDNTLSIIKTKVLIYREQHGRQIGTSRWLKQFIGLELKDRPQLGLNIDGISGATISANSMANSISEVLASIQYLSENDLI